MVSDEIVVGTAPTSSSRQAGKSPRRVACHHVGVSMMSARRCRERWLGRSGARPWRLGGRVFCFLREAMSVPSSGTLRRPAWLHGSPASCRTWWRFHRRPCYLAEKHSNIFINYLFIIIYIIVNKILRNYKFRKISRMILGYGSGQAFPAFPVNFY